MRILFISTPVGPLGSGMGGGVEHTIENLGIELERRSHKVQVLAPVGSRSQRLSIVEIPGSLHTYAQHALRNAFIQFPEDSMLANSCEYAQQNQDTYDVVVNFAYDWLPFFLAPFLRVPVAHVVSMGSLLDSMDRIIVQTAQMERGLLAACTRAQADSFAGAAKDFHILGYGIDLDRYQFCSEPKPHLAWVGRIAPEKGMEDAAAVSEKLNIEVQVMGKLTDEEYWEKCQKKFPKAQLKYMGFLPTEKLQEKLRSSLGLLMTPKWEEAFGIVAIEALACGVPVVAYDRGGIREIVRSSETGFLVEPDSVEELCKAVKLLSSVDRRVCRAEAENKFSLKAYGDRVEKWLIGIVKGAK